MEDYYKILGLNTSATGDEIRRAYRILARRYHPDVNPGKKSEDKFKSISEAYKILSDKAKKMKYDSDFQASVHSGSFRDRQNKKFRAQSRYYQAQRDLKEKAKKMEKEVGDSASKIARGAKEFFNDFVKPKKNKKVSSPKTKKIKISKAKAEPLKVSIIEASVSVQDAIFGIKKTIEIVEPEGTRKVSVNIPPGSRAGKVIRMRSTSGNSEELVIILRVAPHPVLSLESRGLLVNTPVSLDEAIFGATIKVPGIKEEHMIRIPQGSQSGTEVRVKEKGITLKDGTREDIFYRILIQVPKSSQAVGLKEKVEDLEKYYEDSPRKSLPASIAQM